MNNDPLQEKTDLSMADRIHVLLSDMIPRDRNAIAMELDDLTPQQVSKSLFSLNEQGKIKAVDPTARPRAYQAVVKAKVVTQPVRVTPRDEIEPPLDPTTQDILATPHHPPIAEASPAKGAGNGKGDAHAAQPINAMSLDVAAVNVARTALTRLVMRSVIQGTADPAIKLMAQTALALDETSAALRDARQ